MLRAVAFGSRLLPTRPVKDFHLQSSAHAGHTNQPTWLVEFYRSVVETEGAEPLPLLYDRTGRSQRHASDRFRRAVGVTPKVLARIHRLGALLAAVDPGSPVSWTTLAHRFGFFDQAHFNREFRRFSGLSPTRYTAERQRDYPDAEKGENVHFVPQN